MAPPNWIILGHYLAIILLIILFSFPVGLAAPDSPSNFGSMKSSTWCSSALTALCKSHKNGAKLAKRFQLGQHGCGGDGVQPIGGGNDTNKLTELKEAMAHGAHLEDLIFLLGDQPREAHTPPNSDSHFPSRSILVVEMEIHHHSRCHRQYFRFLSMSLKDYYENKKKIRSCFLLSFLLLFLYFLYNRTLFHYPSEEYPLRMSAEVPLILGWNKFFGDSMMDEWLLSENNVSVCPHLCRYSTDRTLEQCASVVIFHIRDGLDPLPLHRISDQLYTFFLLESPVHSHGNYRNVPPDFFNISMTFRHDSDVFHPYDAFNEINSTEKGQSWTEAEVRWKVGNKSKLALQFVSNCHTNSGREKYVAELGKHMELTEMGKCAGRTGCGEECAQKMIDQHFFYLAFENSVCRDYVTEKFWNVKRLIVPVVLSRTVMANLNVPSDAFIAADDFGSPKELADHLQMVAKNEQLYMKHLQWTRKFKKTKHGKGPSNAMCQLCKLAHEKAPRKPRRIENIAHFWEGAGGQCEQQGYAERLLGNLGKK